METSDTCVRRRLRALELRNDAVLTPELEGNRASFSEEMESSDGRSFTALLGIPYVHEAMQH